jgi:hypothetical protein
VIKYGVIWSILLEGAENFIIFVKFIPLWYTILHTGRCIPSATKHFIIPVTTRYTFRSYWPSSGTEYMTLKTQKYNAYTCIYIYIYIYIYIKLVILLQYMLALHFKVFCFQFLYSVFMHFILSFKYHVFNVWGWSVWSKHVVYVDETNRICCGYQHAFIYLFLRISR